ncbi:PREDICTED: uncharacterized protein LOC109467933 isoform X2 [Branchiostoma belcheri]|uniref:Uncharacterized protein LOC109467933 isoform X2 n=1 Tax=Branchiostoma belcheri TaxID=7741 RepID=A0A6P4YB31_BRABE|nr:PREDICTED: uncharacterized protein LOC109467933 isoform X2 [Branchiostoma belcheri]
MEKKPPLLQKESTKSTGTSARAGLPSEGDELEELYESRKAMKLASADAVRPKEPPPPPADVACRPPDPLYVRRAGLRFWCTKRILDWQRQALRAREDPEAVLKPVREYGEESVLQNGENGEMGLKGHYENEHRHYEDDKEHRHYQNDKEHRHYENEKEHRHYENDREHRHYENDEEHKYYQYDENHAHYENEKEHRHYENDEQHRHYENDEEQSNLSTHVYADLDPDFLAAQDAIKNATAQPFYEMDITTADEEKEQPFYKMDVTNAKEKQQEQPFYEMNVASADENNEQVFYRMDGDELGQPTPSENAYEDLDPDFLAAQDVMDRRHGAKEPSRGDDSDDPGCSQNCRVFCRSRPGRMVALFVGVTIAGIVATMVALILKQHGVLRVHPDENNVVNQTSLPATSSTLSAHLPVTSQATSETTEATDWWGEWTLYVRAYFQQNKDAAAGLEERYPDNEVVMTLLEDRFFWPFVCRQWKIYNDLPHTLDTAVGYAIEYGITSDYMESHGLSAYSEVFSSMLRALEALQNKTEGLPNDGKMSLAIVGQLLLDTDVEALVKLFPYLDRITHFYLIDCRISPDAATFMAGQLHRLHTLTKLNLKNNKIGDEGVEAIAETFPHLKELRLLNIANTSITNVGGRAIAKRLVHLQQLQELFLQDNEVNVSALAKAFANMTRLEHVFMWPVTCSSRSPHKAAQQVRDAVYTLAGQVTLRGGTQLYDSCSNRGGTQQGVETAWRRVKDKLTSGVIISNRQLKVEIKLLVPGAVRYPPSG